MARPNNSAAIAGYVAGLKEAKAAFQALPEIASDLLNDATELTVREVVRHAQAKLQSSPSIQTRNLYNHVTWSLNRKSGRGKAGIATGSSVISAQAGHVGKSTIRVKGIVMAGKGGGAAGGRLDKPSRRAHFVEFGTKHMKAEPFMIPAAEGQTAPFLNRCKGAGPLIEKGVAAIGMGGQGGGLL